MRIEDNPTWGKLITINKKEANSICGVFDCWDESIDCNNCPLNGKKPGSLIHLEIEE